nr:hypothetical protein [Kibdelosporangium sp. MJ126-NF4]CEL17858.1 hypothetical protein [Kibdelosporangium sp. MJ126-NF4]CTQ90918.1 hypothetical protein [Kibdelosporangium sp. MJ126-NF4]
MLDEILTRLPPRSRAQLGSRVRALDEQYARRTLPDPFAHWRWAKPVKWWYHRLTA